VYLAARNERKRKGKKRKNRKNEKGGDAEGKDGKRVAGDEERTIDRPIVVVRSICSGEIS